MTTWIFGDTEYTGNDPDTQSLAVNGTALEFAYQRFNIARKKIKENDTVIVVLTNFDRRWFFKAYPEAAEHDTSPTNNKKENNAIAMFRQHLDHKEIHRIYLLDFLYNLHALTEDLKLETTLKSKFMDMQTFLDEIKDQFPLFKIERE